MVCKYGIKLNTKRKEQGLSIEALAKAMTLRTQTTSEMLTGKIKPPEADKRKKAYKLLKLSKDEIEEYEEIACGELGELPEKFKKYLLQHPALQEVMLLAMEKNEGDDLWIHVKDMITRLYPN